MAKGNGQFKIEKGVEFPQGEFGRRLKYPFDKLEVGESFVAAEPHMGSAAREYGMRHNKKFAIRKVSEGYRCWRVE